MYEIKTLFRGFPGMLGLSSWAALTDGSRCVLIDTGCGYARPFIKDILADNGLDFEMVDAVILTHLHWDHIENADLFPNAEFFVSEMEWRSATCPSNADTLVNMGMVSYIASRRLNLVAGNEQLLPGIFSLQTPGHTAGSMSVALKTVSGTIVFSGDAVKTRGELASCCPGMAYDSALAKESIMDIKSLATSVLPGHDGWLHKCSGGWVPEPNAFSIRLGCGTTANGGASTLPITLD